MFDNQDIQNLPPLKDVIREYGLRAEKAFGQNFLLDLNLTKKIASQLSDIENKHVIEIGPGPGGLTRALLLTNATNVTAIEFDERCVNALSDLVDKAHGRLKIRHEDALQADMKLYEGEKVIAANLPYNIATPLLIGWLRDIFCENSYQEMVLMFQKEVADRICANVGEKAYGRLSVISQWICDCKCVMTLPPSAFTPPPKINSGVVKFSPKNLTFQEGLFENLEKITAKAFGQRRKMVRQSLKEYTQFFDQCNIEPTLRAENLTVHQFVKLASLITDP